MGEAPTPDDSPVAAAGMLTAPALSKQYAAGGWDTATVTLDDPAGPTVAVEVEPRATATLADTLAATLADRLAYTTGPVGDRARSLPLTLDGEHGGTVEVVDDIPDDRLTVRVERGGVELATRPAAEMLSVHADLVAHFAAKALDARRMPR